jgi:hypothetical protein
MKVKLYIDLANEYYQDPKNVSAFGSPFTEPMENYTRYVIEVDLPVKHFKPSSERKVKVLSVGEEER